jgi:outer membrane protein TolC
MTFLRLSLVGLAVLLLTSCMVGPDYTRPSAPMTLAYKEAPPPGDGWKLAQPSDEMARDQWWEIFGGPQLNALAAQVTVANQDLKVAEARFREARAMIGFARASEFPTISAGVGISSIRRSDNAPFRQRSFPPPGTFSSPSTSPTSWTCGAASGGRWRRRVKRPKRLPPISKPSNSASKRSWP